MVGQLNVRNKLLADYSRRKLSHTNILIAPTGYGKKELVKWFAGEINAPIISCPGNADNVRKVTTESFEDSVEKVVYIEGLPEEGVAQNILLKFLENPPAGTYIFVLSTSRKSLLTTVLNRCGLIEMESYTDEELREFNSDSFVREITRIPGELIELKDIDIKPMLEAAEKIVEKLDSANISNALKLNTYLKSKNNPDGFSVGPFISCIKYFYEKKMLENPAYLKQYELFTKAREKTLFDEKYFFDYFVITNYMRLNGWTPYT